MIANLLNGGDQMVDIRTRFVILNCRFPRAQIHFRMLNARDLRKLQLNAPHTSLAGHASHLKFDFSHGHISMMRLSPFKMRPAV
jgi:hypothetical protein